MGISERKRELRRRRHRREKLKRLYRKFQSATTDQEREQIIEKVRKLTPGWLDVLRNWGVESPF